MKLKEIFISLVGCFKCTIDNKTFLCTGIDRIIENEDGEAIADLFIWEGIDIPSFTLGERVLVIFNQVKDKIIFLYGSEKYEVISITDKLITVRKDGIDYFIESIQLPV